jgi:flagella basal body P-ring formation protein FlgA
MRAILHITLLVAAGLVTFFTVRPADGAEPASAPIVAALQQAISVPGARLDSASDEKPTGRSCAPHEVSVPHAVDGSGRVAVKVVGTRAGGVRCEAWTWVRVRVVADVAVTRRAIRAGEGLTDAVSMETREVVAGRAPAVLSTGSVAARSLVAGAVVEADAVTVATARLGEQIKVVVMMGGLAVEQSGRATPCVRGRSCAVLPSGRRVEGDFIDGRLLVTLP